MTFARRKMTSTFWFQVWNSVRSQPRPLPVNPTTHRLSSGDDLASAGMDDRFLGQDFLRSLISNLICENVVKDTFLLTSMSRYLRLKAEIRLELIGWEMTSQPAFHLFCFPRGKSVQMRPVNTWTTNRNRMLQMLDSYADICL